MLVDIMTNNTQYHREQRSYLWWQARRKFYNRSPLFRIDRLSIRLWTWPLKPSCDRFTNLVKYYLRLGWNERCPKRSFQSEAQSAQKKKRHVVVSGSYSSAVITFSGFPEHWIIFYHIYNGLLGSTLYKQRRCAVSGALAVSTVKFNYNQQSRS